MHWGNPQGSKIITAVVEAQACIGCGVCIDMCPMSALALVEQKAVVNPELCTACGVCAEECAFGAINIA